MNKVSPHVFEQTSYTALVTKLSWSKGTEHCQGSLPQKDKSLQSQVSHRNGCITASYNTWLG